jgi:hypothetical protein
MAHPEFDIRGEPCFLKRLGCNWKGNMISGSLVEYTFKPNTPSLDFNQVFSDAQT